MKFSIEDFQEWKNSPITIQFFKWLAFEAHLQRSMVAMGGCMLDSMEKSGEEYVKAITKAMLLEDLQNVELEDLEEKANENSPKGAQGVIKAREGGTNN